MSRHVVLLGALFLLGACGSTGAPEREPSAASEPPPPRTSETDGGDEVTAGPKTGSTVTPGPSASVDPPRTAVVVVQHDPESMNAELRVVGDAVGEARGLHALSHPHAMMRFQVVATADPTGRWVVAEMAQMGGYKLRLSDGDGSRFVPIGERRPSALAMRGDVVVVAAGSEVGYVNLREKDPQFISVRTRKELEGTGKAYDVLARDGDWLLAIDDVVMPIYADSFAFDDQGLLVHEKGFEMPGIINGTYVAAELRRNRNRGAGPRDGWLYTLTPYGIMSGHGQDLAALPVRDGATTHGADLTLNSTRTEDPPVLEEHVPRGTQGKLALTAGSEHTPWTGIARLGEDRLLAAAGSRGLLAFPLDFTPETKATVTPIDGEALDVIASVDRVWVLARKDGKCRVDQLTWADGQLSQESSSSFEGDCLRFLR